MIGIGGGGSLGRIIVGTAGAETVIGSGASLSGGALWDISRLANSESSFSVQVGSKLTMGLPGRSLTADGVGSLGLRSLSFMLVAARISSLRISMPSLVDEGVVVSGIISTA